MDLTVGQHIVHTKYGAATVRYVGQDYVGLEFPDGRNALLRRDSFQEPFPEKIVERVEPVENLSWPHSTFVDEDETAQHFPGAHWEPFIEDVGDIVKRLPEIVPAAGLKTAYGDLLKSPRNPHENWQEGFTLAWPSPQMGLAIGIRAGSQANELVGLYPFVLEGAQHTLCLRRVIVWKDGITAQIEADLGDAMIAFFDIDFPANRCWYEVDALQDFILTGIAYGANRAEILEMTFTLNPEQVAWERLLAERRGEEPPETPSTLSLRGMAMLLHLENGDIDEYSFRGTIRRVAPFEDFLGQDGWRVRVTILRMEGRDIDLDIHITRKVWGGDAAPKEGEDIEGTIWLQGRLWSPRTGE